MIVIVHVTICLAAFMVLKVAGRSILQEANFDLPYHIFILSIAMGLAAFWLARGFQRLQLGRTYDAPGGRLRWLRLSIVRLPLFVFPALPAVGLAAVITLKALGLDVGAGAQ
jgi:hypothetical protein